MYLQQIDCDLSIVTRMYIHTLLVLYKSSAEETVKDEEEAMLQGIRDERLWDCSETKKALIAHVWIGTKGVVFDISYSAGLTRMMLRPTFIHDVAVVWKEALNNLGEGMGSGQWRERWYSGKLFSLKFPCYGGDYRK